MALTQTQIIQSLGEALSWFEKELAWGVSPAELNHLTGRIGELYAAMITRGQMALSVNQRGYDVITVENERVSVKTITSSHHVSFNVNTIEDVDRIIVLRLNIDEDNGVSIEELLDEPTKVALSHCRQTETKITYNTRQSMRQVKPLETLEIIDEATFGEYLIRRYESDSIQVLKNNEVQSVAKPHLRELASKLEVSLHNGEGGLKNTRQLGRHVIEAINSV